ncbi:MAG: hypothetical protein Q9P14_15890 [candidate division KSB1 bacterium]|nr:hypothetical protein [candidate division KSB1 bacterium]
MQQALLAQLRSETMDFIAQLHAAERAEQDEKIDRMLTAFARDIERLERQREADLLLIGQELEEIHRATNIQFGETSQMLQQLVRHISYQGR